MTDPVADTAREHLRAALELDDEAGAALAARAERIAAALERIAAALEPIVVLFTAPAPDDRGPCPRCHGEQPIVTACQVCAGTGVASEAAAAEWTGKG